MAKVTRSVLKEIVKECLVEILLEGIDSDQEIDRLSEAVQKPQTDISYTRKVKEIQRKRDRLDQQRVDTRQKKQNIMESVIPALTQDPLMTEIFRDTAQTTLQAQGLSHNTPTKNQYIPADAAAHAVYNNELENLFSGVNNWASLAFSKSDKNTE